MIISRSSITSTSKLNIGYTLSDFNKPFIYPINNIDSLLVKGNFIKNKDNDIEGNLTIKGLISLRDSRNDLPFDYPLNISESFLLFDHDDGEKEGYLLDGKNEISLNDLVVKIILSSLPINPHKEDSKLPSSGDGFKVFTEDEKKESEPYNSAFDKLKDLDL